MILQRTRDARKCSSSAQIVCLPLRNSFEKHPHPPQNKYNDITKSLTLSPLKPLRNLRMAPLGLTLPTTAE